MFLVGKFVARLFVWMLLGLFEYFKYAMIFFTAWITALFAGEMTFKISLNTIHFGPAAQR